MKSGKMILGLMVFSLGGIDCIASESDPEASAAQNEHLGEVSSEIAGFISILRNVGSGLCLDGFSAASNVGAAPYQFTCNPGNTYQRWGLFNVTDNTGIFLEGNLLNEGTGLCLDGFGSTPYLYFCNSGNPYQRWIYFVGGAPSSRALINKQTGMCLDGFGSNPYQFTCNSGNVYHSWIEN